MLTIRRAEQVNTRNKFGLLFLSFEMKLEKQRAGISPLKKETKKKQGGGESYERKNPQ